MSEKSGWTKPVLPSSKSSSPQTLPKSEKSTRRKTLLGFENNGVEFASLEATLQDVAFNGNILSGLKPESEPSISTKTIEKEPALSGRMPISLKNSKIQSDFVADVMKFYTSDYQCFEGDFNSTSVFKETSDHDPETTHVEEHLTDECHLDRKKIDRHNLFNLLPMPKEICVSKFTDSSNPGQPIGCDGTGLRFMITPTKLEFEHNALEPLFCTLALYNFDTGQKLCEDFWFHVNKPDVHRLLPKSLERNYSPLQSCVFNVALPHPAVHFVLCVYKSAGPCDRDDAAEAYVKGATMSDKSRAKWTNDAQDWAQRFGSYRQPLAWGASPVFTDRGELVGSARSATMAVSPLLRWRAGQSPHTALSVDVLRRARVLPGAQLVCQRTSLSETSAKQVLRHAEKNALAVAQSGGGGGNVTRYAAPFNPPSIGLAPHVEPVHELYVYLSSADLSSTSGRNVLCEITLRRSDDAPLPAPSRPPPDVDGPFVSITGVRRAYFQSTLTYHQKKPTYFSECKLLLPVDLGPRAHLVFTFYHVPLPKKTGKKTEDVTPLAVATLPLMQDGAWMVRDGEANLSLAATLPPHYLDAEQQEHIKWLDSGKPLFSLRTRLLSSIVPVGDALQRTLALGYTGRGAMVGTASAALSMGGPPPPLMAAKRSPITSDSIDAALQACGMLSRASVLQWMPHIFARLFTIIQSSSASTEQQRQALIALLDSATTAQKASQPQRATAAWRERTLQDIDLDELSKPPVSPRRTGSHVSQFSMREEEDSADRDVKLEARAWRRHSARQNPLTAYVAFTFGCSESDATLHEPLARAWSNALRARGAGGSGFQARQSSSSPAISPLPSPLHSDSSSLDHRSSPNVRAQVTAPRFSKATLTHCDFLFTLLLKSLLMHDAAERTARQQQQQTTGVRVGSNRWNEAMQRLVARLGKRLSDADASGYGLIVEEAVIATARFIRRALCVMDRGVVLNAAELFLAELAPTPQLTAADAGAVDTAQLHRRFMYRVQFVRIVCDQRQYPSIAMPRLVKLDHSVAHTLARHARRHYVAALAVYAATSALRCDESVVREPAIAQLLTLLWRHDNDARLRGRTRLSLVASLYFPLLPALLDAFDSMRATASRRELALWLLAAFWLLRNLRVATLQQWMLRETQTRRRRLFDLLTLGITLFDPNTSSGTTIGKSESEEYRRRRSSGEFSSTSDTLAALKNAASAADSPQAAVDVIVSVAPAANNSISSASPARLSRRRRSRDLTNTPEAPFIPTSISLTPFFKKTQQRESPWLSVEDRMESNDESSVSNVVSSRSDVASYHSATSGVVPAAKRATGGVDALARTASSDHATHRKGESLSMSDTSTDAPKKVHSFRVATPKSRRASAVPRLGSGRRAAELVSFDFWPLALGRSLSCDLTVELGLTALDVTMAFVQRFERQLLGGTTDSDDLFERVFGVLLAVARRADAVFAPQFARVAMATLTTTLERFRAPLFGLSNTVSGELCDVLVRQCNAEQRPINEQGVATLFFVLQQNYAAVGNVSRTRLQTTIAVTRLLGGASTRSVTVHASALRRAFGSIVELAEAEVSAQRSGTSSHEAAVAVASEAEALAGVIASLIRDTSKITAVRQVNAAATADLLHSVSRDMWAAPDLRLAWLLNLAQYQRDGKRFEEAAQTRITCAVLVAEYLKLLGRFGDAMAAANARQLCPSVDSELAVMPQAVELAPVRDDICQSKMFSEDGFVALLMEAIELLKLGGLHESCVASYQMVLPIHSRRGDYQKQREAYEDLARQCAHITEAASHNETLRQFSKYYRVAFFGKAFGALHNTEYVYKQSSFTRVMDMSSALKRHHPSVEFELLPNKIDARQHLDTDKKAYIQLVAVEPHFNPDELTNRPTTFEQNFNLLRFRYETPFTKSGKSHGEIKDQWKRKTILTVEAPFPHMRHRLKVVETEENDVAPIESAIEQLERKTFTLMAEVKAARPQAKQLQMHLQGSLLTAVNAGPFAICEAFLSPKERGSHSTSDADKLYETMCGLERALGEAVRLNANLIAGEQVELQAALEEGYAVFCKTLRQYATETESVIASLTVAPRTDATAGDLSAQLVQADAAATRDADALKLATAGDAANALAAHNSALLDAAPSSAVTRLHASARSQPPVVPPRPRSPPPPPLPADQADFSTSTPPGTPPLPRRRTSDRPPTPPLPDDPPAPPLPPNSVTTAHDDVVNSKMQAIKTSMFGLLNELNGRVQRAADSINDNSTPPRALLMLGSQLKNARPTLESAAASLGTLLPPTPESLVQGRPGDDAAAKLARLRALLLHSLDEVTLLSNAARRATEAVDAPADLPPLANVVRQLHDLLGD